MKGLKVKLAGVSFGDAPHNIQKFGYRDIFWYGLRREPHNPYDRNAISVHCIGRHMGYVPREMAKYLAQKMDAGEEYEAKFVSRNEHPYFETVGLTVEIVPAAKSTWREKHERNRA